jgi:hypothetical protein
VEDKNVMKDYYYNENNVLVPRIKLDKPAPASTNQDDQDDASVTSSRSQRQRVRRGGRRPGTEKEDEAEHVGESPKRPRPRNKFSFWDTETDSSGSEEEVLRKSPLRVSRNAGKSTMMASPRKRAQTVSPPRVNNSKTCSDGGGYNPDGSDSLQGEKELIRRVPSRNNSGWHTGGSFSEDESENSREKQSRNPSLSKLSLAALRMSRATKPTFSFTKNNATLDTYSSHGNNPQPVSLSRDVENEEIDQGSNHSSASKTTSSCVSAGGWSTGKDTSSDEEEVVRRPRKNEKFKNKKTEEDRLKVEPEPFTEFDKPESNLKFSGHSNGDTKLSFITGDDDSLASGSTFSNESGHERERSHRLSTDSDIRLDSQEDTQDGTVVFDLSAMEFDTEGIFEDEPCSPAKRREIIVQNIPSTANKKTKNESCFSTKEKLKDKNDSSKQENDLGEHGKKKTSKPKKEKSKKSKDEAVKTTKVKVKKKSGEKKEVTDKKAQKKKKEAVRVTTTPPEPTPRPAQTSTVSADPFLEARRKERAARLEKAKERIRKEEAAKKAEEDARKKKVAAAKPTKIELSEKERVERAYQWYTRCGLLTKKKLKERIHKIEYCEITEEDIDLLPWMIGDRMVNVGKMTKILAGRG